MKIDSEDFGTLAVCSIRYCQGRETYMPELVRGIIRPHLSELSNKDLQVMINDCEFQSKCGSYGDEQIDKPGWIKWRDTLLNEQARRKQ